MNFRNVILSALLLITSLSHGVEDAGAYVAEGGNSGG